MFRHFLTAAVMAAGLGFAGTAQTAEAHDRHRFDRGRHFDHGRFHRGHDHGRFNHRRGDFRIQPYPYYGRSHFRGGYYGRPGGFYGRPYGGTGIFIGTDRFQLGILR